MNLDPNISLTYLHIPALKQVLADAVDYGEKVSRLMAFGYTEARAKESLKNWNYEYLCEQARKGNIITKEPI